jgi:ribose 5-phosphate isomerase A
MKAGAPFITDGGHLILDCAFGALPEPEALAARLNAIPGVVEHGLFIGMATTILCAGANGVEALGEAA